MNLYTLFIVGLGGFVGSTLRYLTVRLVDTKLNALFPFGTLTVNIVGSFLLGLIYMLAMRKVGISENAKLFLGVGFCGGFTTFSAFALENFSLIEQKLIGTAVLYIIASVVMGILALAFGIWASRYL